MDVLTTWENAAAQLAEWHRTRLTQLGRAVAIFLEKELRLMVPPLVRRRWANEQVEDVLRGFLTRLVTSPLPDGVENLKAYLRRSFAHYCIDAHRSRARRQEAEWAGREQAWVQPSAGHSPVDQVVQIERRDMVLSALSQLTMVDRVVLKLEHAPEWLSVGEVAWLAGQSGRSVLQVKDAILAANDMHAVTRIFDHEDDDPADPDARRKRMERFRRRRSRARTKLRAILSEDTL